MANTFIQDVQTQILHTFTDLQRMYSKFSFEQQGTASQYILKYNDQTMDVLQVFFESSRIRQEYFTLSKISHFQYFQQNQPLVADEFEFTLDFLDVQLRTAVLYLLYISRRNDEPLFSLEEFNSGKVHLKTLCFAAIKKSIFKLKNDLKYRGRFVFEFRVVPGREVIEFFFNDFGRLHMMHTRKFNLRVNRWLDFSLKTNFNLFEIAQYTNFHFATMFCEDVFKFQMERLQHLKSSEEILLVKKTNRYFYVKKNQGIECGSIIYSDSSHSCEMISGESKISVSIFDFLEIRKVYFTFFEHEDQDRNEVMDRMREKLRARQMQAVVSDPQVLEAIKRMKQLLQEKGSKP